MKKALTAAGIFGMVCSCFLLSSCAVSEGGTGIGDAVSSVQEAVEGAGKPAGGFFGGSSSYFDNYEAERTGDSYQVSGEVHIAQDQNTEIMAAEPEEDLEIHIKGAFKREKGEMRLVYEAADKTVTVIAESTPGEADETKVDQQFTLKAGAGSFKLLGNNSVFTFELTFSGLPDDLKLTHTYEKMHTEEKLDSTEK